MMKCFCVIDLVFIVMFGWLECGIGVSNGEKMMMTRQNRKCEYLALIEINE